MKPSLNRLLGGRLRIFAKTFTGSLIVLVFGIAGAVVPLRAQEQAHTPRTLIDEHRAIERRLEDISREAGRVGAAAKRVLAIIVPHQRREEEFVLPLLGLMDAITEGGVSADMAWAVPMSNRVRAERSTFYDEHSKIVVALDDLTSAARQRHDEKLVAFCRSVAGHATNDNEVIIPAAILIGTYVARELGVKG